MAAPQIFDPDRFGTAQGGRCSTTRSATNPSVQQLARLVRTADRVLYDLRVQIDALHEHFVEVAGIPLRGGPPVAPERRRAPRLKRRGPPLRRARLDLRTK